MKITYLGTGACMGAPALFCNCPTCTKAREDKKNLKYNTHTRPQVLIDDDLLIDFPADSMAHALYNNINFANVTDLILTHPHSDHYLPADFLLRSVSNNFSYSEKELTLHISKGAECQLMNCNGNDYERLKNLHVRIHNPEYYVPFDTQNFVITPVPAKHAIPGVTPYAFIIRDKRDGKTVFHYCDSGRLTDEEVARIAALGVKFDLITFDCTMGNLDCLAAWGEKAAVHMGIPDFVVVRDKFIKVGVVDDKTICIGTHLSHFCPDICYDDLKPAADEADVTIAYDGLVVEL